MPSRTEKPPLRFVVYGFLLVFAVLAAIPGYLALGPSWRPVAVRTVCALIVIVGCVRIVGRVRRAQNDDAPSVLDAPPPPHRGPAFDERFLRLRDDLVFSSANRRYFEVFLRPRLCALAGSDLPATAERRRRGPSLRELSRLIAEIERRA